VIDVALKSMAVTLMQPLRSEFLPIRLHRYHYHHWGDPSAPKIVMLHGWMDVGASFQFVVDHLQKEWHVIAPDLRGFGLTSGPPTDVYSFPDYLADLDALLNHISPDEPVNLVGHSMGGNIVALYAGIRPERVAKLVMLEGFGLPATTPNQAPQQFRRWLDAIRAKPQLMTYPSVEAVVQRLQKNNPRLSDEKAMFLAQHWSRQNQSGQWEILGDPAHKLPSPLLYRVDEVMACWAAITAPVLWVEAADTEMWHLLGGKDLARAETDRRLTYLKNVRTEVVSDAGHMLHHDQPQVVAGLIERFLMDGC
jgi:pimeloyl-ACP methyl ester carboxylesterase